MRCKVKSTPIREKRAFTFAIHLKLLEKNLPRLRTNNALERIMKEIRRRTRVIGAFPDGYSAMMLVGARLRHIMGNSPVFEHLQTLRNGVN